LPGESLAALSRAARRGGGHLAVVNPDHYLPSRQLIRKLLDAGKLGEAALVRIHRWEPATAGAGLAPLLRDLELAVWLIGKFPDLVYAVEHVLDDGDSHPLVQVHLGFPGGAMALIDFTTRLPPGDGYSSLSAIGSAGAAYHDDHHNVQIVYRGGSPRALRTPEGDNLLAALLQDFIDALAEGRDLSAGVAAWQRAELIAGAVMLSLRSHRAVDPEGL
jgi:predicted dehydrogenase